MLSQMSQATGKCLGRYLYALTDVSEPEPIEMYGIDAGLVYTVDDGHVAAVVSDIPIGKIRPERRRLAAHHEVLKRLMVKHTVLPMSFGVVAESTEAILKILSMHQEMFREELSRLAGKVEMGLRVLWDVPNIFEFFVSISPDLRLFRDRVFRGGRQPTHEDKMEVGRLFDRVLMEARQEQTENVMAALRSCSSEIKENKPRNEFEIMNLACLVDRNSQKEFERAVFEAARYFDHHYAFDFNGPWPPHNFVEMTLSIE